MNQALREERTYQVLRLVVWTLFAFGILAVYGSCEEPPKINWAGPLAFHAAIHGGDYWSSVTSGGVEVGPIASRAGLVPTKVGGFLLTYGADLCIQKLQGRNRYPAWIYRGILGFGYGWVVVHNRSVK